MPFVLTTLQGPGKLSCLFWNLFLQLVISLLGFILYCCIAKWYQQRQRGDNYYARNVIEEVYEKMLQEESWSDSITISN